jgi:DNA-binding NarL/FixJ family response regulator
MTYSKHVLRQPEMLALVTVAEQALQVQNLDEFKTLIRSPVTQYFPHEQMTCAIGELFGDRIRIWQLIHVNCTETRDSEDSNLQQIKRITDHSERGIVQRWLLQQRARIINVRDDAGSAVLVNAVDSDKTERASVGNLAAFGSLDLVGEGGTYFSFARIHEHFTPRDAYKLELLLPFLHQALVRVFKPGNALIRVPAQPDHKLTKRERQVLDLLSSGMSNRDIAERLSRSESTVQNHMYAIFKKLGVRSRSAAIAYCHRKMPRLSGGPCGPEAATAVRQAGTRMKSTQSH